MVDDYEIFLRKKICLAEKTGFDVDSSEINQLLKPHQKDIVKWCISGGCRAIFAAFGLGKTFIQLEILRLIQKYEGGKQLIIAPLGVRQEFKFDSKKLGINIEFVNKDHQVENAIDGIYITNYESVRDNKLSIKWFNCATLDEASVLRSFGSKTYQTFLSMFSQTKYKFVATATPSPNRYKELIHYAGYLGIMDTGQALTRFFQRDSTKANKLTLYPHEEKNFWLWLSSWAVFLQKPSDLGYDDDGYVLPPLKVHFHKCSSSLEASYDKKTNQINMFADASLSLSDASSVKRQTITDRISEMMKIIDKNPDKNFIIWHDQEIERKAITKALKGKDCKAVYGTMDIENREDIIADFSNGKLKYLATKPVLSGSGCNFQRHCSNAIFLGIGFKFNDFIQAVHRIYRFLQTEECNIYIIYSDAESRILQILKQKWENHERMVENMSNLIKEHGLSISEMETRLRRSIGSERIEVIGERYKIVNNDCVIETSIMEENSVDMILTSIPFANHYEYTPSYNDFGHTKDNDHFWNQMDFLTPNLLKILRPGRIYACHTKDRIVFGNATGAGLPRVSPFHAECIFHSMKHGFDYIGMITVITDVVRENNQTYRLGWTENCKDGSKMGVGSPEYILLFHKPQSDRTRGYADVPVTKSKDEYSRSRWQIDAHAFWRSSGNRFLTFDEFKNLDTKKIVDFFTKRSIELIYDYEAHVKIGENLDLKGNLPTMFMALAPASHSENVWHDVTRMQTLNGNQAAKKLNLHVCPLQFDIVNRLIERYTNKDEIVFDPFGGLMTVPFCAVKKGRIGMGVELNSGYFGDGAAYCNIAEKNYFTPTLFDVDDPTVE
jgi:DNA modification methylase/predicted DNA-binding protein YlxM (UPF0122 family)